MRTSATSLDQDAERAFRDACEANDLPVRIDLGIDDDTATVSVDGVPRPLAIHGATLIDAARVATLVERRSPAGAIPVVVADRILGDARPLLDAAGWGWLDRRGRLHLRTATVIIDLDIDPAPRAKPRRRPSAVLASHGAQEAAVALLLAPGDPPGVREIARATGFAPSTISRSLTELRAAGLIRADNRPVTPDLFWLLAGEWAPDWHTLARRLDVAVIRFDDLGANLRDVELSGYAATDTVAALAWRAPVVASADAPVSLYVPDHRALDRVLDEWGHADGGGGDRVAVAPVGPVTRARFRRPDVAWPVVHPLFVALDLATDRARGHQVIDEWNPVEVPRVW